MRSGSRRLGVRTAVVDGRLVPGDVAVADGRIEAVGLPPARSGLAVPGLTDLQVNGYAGQDLLTAGPDGWADAAVGLARDGVTAYLANLITSPDDVLDRALRTTAALEADHPARARLLGVQLEGPFLAPSRAGTHPAEHLRAPDVGWLRHRLGLGPVRSVVLAPRLPGADDVIAELRSRGVLVALGHSGATDAQAQAGFDTGAATVVHVFNAMSAPTARDAGLAGVALTRTDVAVQVIADGVHLAEDVLRLVCAAAPDRLVLVTDALAPTGGGDGAFSFGTLRVSVRDGRACRDDGTLAGSVAPLRAALRRVVDLGLSPERAVTAATTRPRRLVTGAPGPALRPGDDADVLVLDDAFDVVRTLVGGVPAGRGP